MKCSECNFTGDEEELKEHFKYYHFLNWTEALENNLILGSDSDPICFKCNSHRHTLTWTDPDYYYLPCWDCITRKSDITDAKSEIQKNIRGFYKRIIGDRFFQLYILDDIYPSSTIPHTYPIFNKVLKSLKLPKDRDDFWFIDWYPGYPRIISLPNLSGIKIVNLTNYFKDYIDTGDKIKIRDFEICFPERVPYEPKHYSRYNILNPSSSRKTKRLRFTKSTNCIKFYNTPDPSTKSIFMVLRDGVEVQEQDLTKKDMLVLKMAIFRNRSACKLVFDVIQEIIKSDIGIYRDSIFLKNTIRLNPEVSDFFNLTWVPEYNSIDNNSNNIINISIL